jgi:hypothetical protein
MATNTAPITATPDSGSEINVKGQTVNNLQADTVTLEHGSAGDIHAQAALISWGVANTVQADTVELRLGAAQQVHAQQLTVRQGLVGQSQAENLTATQSALVFAETQTANLTGGMVGAVLSKGEVKLDQSFSRAVITRGDITMDQSGGGVVVARQVNTDHNTTAIFVLTGRVNGKINAVFGPASSAAFGAAFALVMFFGWWLKRQLSR